MCGSVQGNGESKILERWAKRGSMFDAFQKQNMVDEGR